MGTSTSFRAWLRSQRGRQDEIGAFARLTATDSTFPAVGAYEMLRNHVHSHFPDDRASFRAAYAEYVHFLNGYAAGPR